MKKIICLLIILFSIGSIWAQKFLKPSDKSLDSLFRILQRDPESLHNQAQFFDKFPRSFQELNKTYDYRPRGNPMSSLYYDHIFNGFAKLDKIPEWKYYKRLINLSINGKWDADAVNALKEVLENKAQANPELLFSLLSLHLKEEIYSFWYFYFNSLLPLKGGIPVFLKNMEKEYPTVYGQLKKAFQDSDGQAICPTD